MTTKFENQSMHETFIKECQVSNRKVRELSQELYRFKKIKILQVKQLKPSTDVFIIMDVLINFDYKHMYSSVNDDPMPPTVPVS